MKKLKLITLCMLFIMPVENAITQNLVPNAGFEAYSELPNDAGQWSRCDVWNNAGGSPVGGFYGDPDYFHSDGVDAVQLPETNIATLDPHSGSAVMGFLGYHDPYDGSEIREYIMVELTEPMIVGKQYDISFWITNGFEGQGHRFKCNRIGINFTTAPLDQEGSAPILDTPELEIEGELFTTAWQEITFTYTADAAYTYLTIGNFYSDAETSVSVAIEGPLPFAGAYYFVDDFSVQQSDISASTRTVESPVLFTIAPNPSTDKITLSIGDSNAAAGTYTIYSSTGQLVQAGLTQKETPILVNDFEPGIYFISVIINGKETQQKFIKY